MGDLLVNIAIILVLILVGACFVAAELAIVSLRDSQVTRLVEEGGRRGRRLKDLTADPNRFLAAGQVGVTLTGFLSAAFGESRISPEVVPVLVDWGLSETVAQILVLLLVTMVIAYLSLVLGELVPKRIALQRAERLALVSAGPLDAFARLLRPVISLLSLSTNAIVRLFGIDPTAQREGISGAELRDLVAAHVDLSVEERDLIDDVFSAGDRELREVMIPRTEVTFLSGSMRIAEALTTIAELPHSRYPVTGESVDDVLGFVHIRDVLLPGRRPDTPLRTLARPVIAFPGTKPVLGAMAEMRRRRQHLALVLDEYSGTAGIVTMEDLVEEVIGDIEDEYDTATIHGERLWESGEVDGLMNLADFADVVGTQLPQGPYETVAGFLVATLGRLPEVGSSIVSGDLRMEVLAMDGRRASRIRVIRQGG